MIHERFKEDALLENLRAALRQSPENIPLRLSVAELLIAAHRADEAESELLAGLELTPEDGQLKAALAHAFFARGAFSKALVLCEQLISKGPAGSELHLLCARCHLKLEDEPSALRSFLKARDFDPNVEDADLEALLPKDEATTPPAPEPSLEYTSGRGDGEFVPYVERPSISFADVGGMQALKRQIGLKIIEPIKNPEIYRAYGKKIGGGILMYGPPGCGKTHLARATAGEVDARFLSVAISDVLDMYTGQSERNLHELFQNARSAIPSVMFFDEVDALAASRRDMRQSAGRQVINQFLAELDGVDADNEGVLILAATNAPWHLDGAFRRPGRFDRVLFVPPPDEEARTEILRVLLADKPAREVDIQQIAKKTRDFSGADLKALVDVAIEDKLEGALASGVPDPLSTKDLLRASKRVRPTTKEWFKTARNYALYSNEGGLYNDILDYMGIKK